MGLIGSVLLGALAILGAVCVKVFADEFKAWAPTIVAKIIEAAVRTLPAELRERFSEEWPSHIDQIPGDVGKITVACGFLIAAFDMADGQLGLRKRVLDIALASFALVFFGPAFLLTALAIKLDTAGPIIVRHTRMGLRGKPFQALKFRTMRIDAPEELTAIGRRMRSGIDELPQLLNVLLGDMSLVGPRPLSVDDDLGNQAKLIDLYKACKPGLTGLWVFGRTTKDIAYYAKNWSLKLDAKILLATIGAVVKTRDGDEFSDLEAGWKIGLLTIIMFIGVAFLIHGIGAWISAP